MNTGAEKIEVEGALLTRAHKSQMRNVRFDLQSTEIIESVTIYQ